MTGLSIVIPRTQAPENPGPIDRVELLTNPSFEVNTDGREGSTLERVTTEKYVGEASMKVTPTAVASNGARTKSGQTFRTVIDPAKTVTALLRVKGPNGVGYILRLNYWSTANVFQRTDPATVVADGPTFKLVTVESTPPAGAATCYIELYKVAADGANVTPHYIDAASITQPA